MFKQVLLIFIVLIINNSFSQVIEKKEVFYHEECELIRVKDSITYFISNHGILVVKNISEDHFLSVKVVETKFQQILFAEVNKEQLIIINKDTLLHFDISNPENPLFVKKFQIPFNLLEFYTFGDYYILVKDNFHHIITQITTDSMKFIYATYFTGNRHFNFPYVFIQQDDMIVVYEYPYFHLYTTIVDSGIKKAASAEDILVYYTQNSTGKRIKVIDLRVPGFTYLHNHDVSSYINNFANIFAVSNFYFANRESSVQIFKLDATQFKTYPQNYKLTLSGNKIYGYLNNQIFYLNKKITLKDFYPSYSGLSLTNRILRYKNDHKIIDLLENRPDNTFNQLATMSFNGTLLAGDSMFYISNNKLCSAYSVANNMFSNIWTYNFLFDFTKVIDFRHHVYVKKSASIELYKKDLVNQLTKIFVTSEYRETTNAILENNSLFISDEAKGVVRYEITETDSVIKKWQWGLPSKNYRIVKYSNYLVILGDNKLYLMDINHSEQAPLFVYIQHLIEGITYNKLIATKNGIFVTAKINSPMVFKYSVINNKLQYNYHVDLDSDSEFDFTVLEVDNKFLLVSSRVIYWVRDNTLSINSGWSNNLLAGSALLNQNYPNPFNSSTTISYRLAEAGQVSLKMYDILGREVMDILNESKTTGEYQQQIECDNLPSGIYIVRLRVNNFLSSKKIVLMK